MPPAKDTNHDLRPNPDPTTLTTQQLLREMGLLKELLVAKFEEAVRQVATMREIIETRLDASDKALSLLKSETDKIPNSVDQKLGAVKEIIEEKFTSVALQFKERDVRTEQSNKDSKVAVDAALQAAKEAVSEQNKSSALAIAKSETATTKQIDQLGALIQTGSKALDDKIGDQKERLTRIESEKLGAKEKVVEVQAASNSSNLGLIAGIIGAVVGAAGGAAGLIAVLSKH